MLDATPNTLAFDAESAAYRLNARLPESPAEAVITAALEAFGDRFALVSSFGTESAVLLHLAAQVSRRIPVLFLDTEKLFGETKRYKRQLTELLGLEDVRTIKPDPADVQALDPAGSLWVEQTNQCCFIRKVKPLNLTLEGFDAWATGRKRYHGAARAALPHFEASDGRVKVNPIAFWTHDEVKAYAAQHDLPAHPLVEQGFTSVGCMPCTEPAGDASNLRGGRWSGSNKTECGIHLSLRENRELVSLDAASL